MSLASSANHWRERVAAGSAPLSAPMATLVPGTPERGLRVGWFVRSNRHAGGARGSSSDAPAPTAAASTPNPDHAWKVLSITNEWVRHADSKTGVTLAFVGATAAALFNLIKDYENWTGAMNIATGAAIIGVFGAVLFAVLELLPRTKLPSPKRSNAASMSGSASEETIGSEESVNLLFFGDVHSKYGHDRPTYRDVLSLLTADSAELTKQISDQIHANAHIASVKFRQVNRAILCELGAVAATAAVVVIQLKGW